MKPPQSALLLLPSDSTADWSAGRSALEACPPKTHFLLHTLAENQLLRPGSNTQPLLKDTSDILLQAMGRHGVDGVESDQHRRESLISWSELKALVRSLDREQPLTGTWTEFAQPPSRFNYAGEIAYKIPQDENIIGLPNVAILHATGALAATGFDASLTPEFKTFLAASLKEMDSHRELHSGPSVDI